MCIRDSIHSAHLAGGHSFLQVRDIRLDGSWGGIGTDIKSFTGRYDGGYHTITFPNQTLSSGLFIYVVDSTITSLGIENAAISSSAARGALAAVCMGNTRITDCYALNSIVYGYAAGGLVGTAEKGSVLELSLIHIYPTHFTSSISAGVPRRLSYEGGK